MGNLLRIERLSVEDYLEGERTGDVRHEYVDGELFAMVGASRAHNVIGVNFASALRTALAGGRCRVTASDMKVRPATSTRFYYPDVMVSCGDPRDEPDEYFETRPSLIVEVLSATTEAVDRREKRLAYATIESLHEYVLVAQHERAVELYRRDGEGWSCTTLGAGETLVLEFVHGLANKLAGGPSNEPPGRLEITLATLYDGVPFAT